jgi:DNA-directed RNA polymerase subunit alpha
MLAGQTRVEMSSPEPESELPEDDGDEPAELMTPIEELNLSARTTNALINNDIHNLKDLVTLSDSELRDLRGFGNKALEEVKDKISNMEL